MSEWKTYKWGDLISLEYGKPIPDKNLLDGQYPVYGTNGRIGTSNLTPLCKHPSIIVGRKGAYRGVHYSNKPFSVIDTAFFVEPKTSILDLKWAYYKLLTVNINKMDSGSAIPSTDRYEIYSLSVELPSLDEQRRIAGILGSLDDKIELNRRINANLEAQAQALFRSWFVDFEPFRDGPFVDSELGKIPQGWKVETLSNLATVIKKGITPSNSETYSHYSIPAYDDAHFPEKQSGETIKSGKYIVYNNSILLSKLNPRIKRLWFIKTAEENAICSTEFIPIQTKDTELISFVFYLIDSDIFYQQALSLVNGATGSHQRFHAEDIMQIPFAWNKDAAIDFAQKANYILQKIEDNIRENQTLSALRDTMLPKLMAGEIAIE